MNTINKRLITDLFEKKEMAYDSNIYNKLYNDIWPCEDEFKQFLYATDSSVKINCAKNIFQYYLSDYDMIFPDFFIAEIVSIQQKDLKTTLGYVPQDHLVHSINLYILGIYSFFNIEVFHRKLLQEYIGESYIDQHKSFIKEWALFALYHDIGYVVEGNVDKHGIIRNKEIVKKYTNIYDTLLNKHIIQSVAKLITNIHIIKNCKNRYTVDKTEIFRYQWVINSKITDNNKLFKDLSCFSNHIELTLNSNNDIDFADWLLQSDDHLILYKDKDGIPIVFILVYKDKIKQIIYNSTIKSRCMIAAQHFNSTLRSNQLNVALVITTSAGMQKRPTMHRMVISRNKICEKQRDLLLSQLKLNDDTIFISKEKLNLLESDIVKELNNSKDSTEKHYYNAMLKSIEEIRKMPCESYYKIDEAIFYDSTIISNDKKIRAHVICKIREYTENRYYNKLSNTVHEICTKIMKLK